MKTSIIWKLPRHEFQELVNSCNTKREILIKLGLNKYSGNHRTLDKRINQENIDLSILNKNRAIYLSKINTHDKLTLNEIITKDAKCDQSTLRKIIIKHKLIPYKCAVCNIDTWCGQKLSLHLDHKNGINNDNRIENLRFLCPNCHSLTPTYARINMAHKLTCLRCQKLFSKTRKFKRKYCPTCEKIVRRNKSIKINNKEQIIEALLKFGNVRQASKYLKVSDKGLAKACNRMGINYKKLCGISDSNR